MPGNIFGRTISSPTILKFEGVIVEGKFGSNNLSGSISRVRLQYDQEIRRFAAFPGQENPNDIKIWLLLSYPSGVITLTAIPTSDSINNLNLDVCSDTDSDFSIKIKPCSGAASNTTFNIPQLWPIAFSPEIVHADGFFRAGFSFSGYFLDLQIS
ncbi:MAG: hypothetical protein QXV52_08865 [Nitrososphaeria archaeon]